MLKKHSIIKLFLLGIIAVLGILLCVCPFSVPSSSKTYNGFLYAIEKGIDIDGGVVAEYSCQLPTDSTEDIDKVIDNSLSKIKNIISTEDFKEYRVERQGDDKIRIEVAGTTDTNSIFNYLGEGKAFYMTYEEASDSLTPEVFVTSKDIKSAKPDVDYEAQTYGVTVSFTKDGLKNIDTLKNYANKTSDKKIYVYVDQVNSDNLVNSFSASDVKDNLFISSTSTNYSTSSYSDSKKLAYSIVSGATGDSMELDNANCISPKLGMNTKTLLVASFCVVVGLATILLAIRYRELGLLAILSLAFFLVLDLFFLQAIPIITLNVAGVVGILFGLIVAIFAHVIIFEKMREEYAMGKKLHLSCKGGFKKALWPILDSHFVLGLICVFIWILAPASLKVFAIIMLVSLILSLFSSLCLLRYFVYLYLPINSRKANRVNFKRSKQVKEISEEVEIIPEDKVSSLGGDINE